MARLPARGSGPGTRPSAAKARGPSAPPLILVADDEPLLLRLAARFLSRRGFAVDTAADGRAALDAMSVRRPDLVILDLDMPVLTGWRVLEDMRGSEKTRTLPVLLVTAEDDPAVRERGRSLGAEDFLLKPYSLKELLENVNVLLSGRERPVTRAGRAAPRLQGPGRTR